MSQIQYAQYKKSWWTTNKQDFLPNWYTWSCNVGKKDHLRAKLKTLEAPYL